jgi:O-acetyl-ADP-ribose deacetylase (regulator of RNase III)
MSKLTVISGNVLDINPTKVTLIPHIVNFSGIAFSGVAGAIRKKYPKTIAEYEEWYKSSVAYFSLNDEDDGYEVPFNLGQILPCKVSDNLYIVHLLSQASPGGDTIQVGDKKVYLRPIRLDCLEESLYRLAALAHDLNAEVHMPKIGSLRAGGNFDTEILPLIQKCLVDNNIEVVVYEFKE